MNLTKPEIIAFLGIWLEKNPVTGITLDKTSMSISHLDGKFVTIDLTENSIDEDFVIDYEYIAEYNQSNEYDHFDNDVEFDKNDYTALIEYYEDDHIPVEEIVEEEINQELPQNEVDYIPYFTEIEEKLEKYFASQEQFIEEYSSGASVFKDKQSEILSDFIKTHMTNEEKYSDAMNTLQSEFLSVKDSIFEQIDFIKTQVEKTSDSLFEKTDSILLSIPKSLNEENIAETILNQVRKELKENKSDILSELEKIQVTTNVIENTNTIDVSAEKIAPILEDIESLKSSLVENKIDYSYIDTLFQTKIDNLRVELTADDKKAITNFENRKNRLIVTFTDGTFSDITDLILPLVRMNIENMLPKRSSGGFGGGVGGGRGDPGFSAYQIALNRGFVGTEEQWLSSLHGGEVTPQPGTINRNLTGDIESVLVGDKLTTFIRDVNGNISQIVKYNHTKTFTRNIDGQITGWTISY